jgi:hypothetical protein
MQKHFCFRLEMSQFGSWSVPTRRAELARLGLETSGTKEIFVARLTAKPSPFGAFESGDRGSLEDVVQSCSFLALQRCAPPSALLDSSSRTAVDPNSTNWLKFFKLSGFG